MTSLILRNTATSKTFKIVSRDKAAGTVTLQGDHAAWEEPWDKERFKKLGYVLERVEAEDDTEI